MKKGIVITVAVVLLAALIIGGIAVAGSPEVALLNIAKDVKESGVDGLLPHLTDGAEKTISSIVAVSENKIVGMLMSLLGDSDYTGVLKNNLKDVEWEINDILKGKDKAEVVLDFDYEGKLCGTVEINMIRKDGEWRISGIDLPKFEKINLK